MLLLASILLLSLERVTSTPQLRLSQTGYEIISFDDQTTDDSLPTATNLTLQNVSRHNGIGAPDLEKSESGDDHLETLMDRINKLQLQLQGPIDRKPHELQRTVDTKTISQIHRNTGDKSVKGSSIVPNEKTKEFSSETSANIISKNSLDDSHEKESTWMNNSRFNKKKMKKTSKIVKQPIFNDPTDSDFDSSESKEDSKLDKITTIVTDLHRSFDKIGTKSDFEEKQEKIDPIFPTIGKLPSIQINRQKNFYIPSKNPSMYSPIYTSGFDKISKKFQSDISSNGPKNVDKSRQLDKFSSLMILKNIFDNTNRDFNSRSKNRFPFASLLPLTGTSLYVSPFSFMLQKSLRPFRPSDHKHLELNSIPLIPGHVERLYHSTDLSLSQSQGRLDDFINSVNDPPKINSLDNYLENKYFDSKANKRMEMLRSKNDFFKKYLGKIHTNSPTPIKNNFVKPAKEISNLPKSGLVIDIFHEITPENSEEIIFDKENSPKVQKIQDTLQAPFHSSMSCKHMKPITPPFYQFLTKFSDILLDNAQKYETSLQIREDAAKLIDRVKNKNLENL